MKKILVVLGGGRKNGNTEQLAKAFITGAEEAGHEAELISLNELKVTAALGATPAGTGNPVYRKTILILLFQRSKGPTSLFLLRRCIFGQCRPKSRPLSKGFTVLLRRMRSRPSGAMKNTR